MSNQTEPGGARSFGVMLTQLRQGEFHAECGEELQALMKKLEQYAITTSRKGKGVMTIKLAFTVDDRGVVQVVPDLSIKEPKPIRGEGIFWITKDGNLSPENERQPKLPGLREVPQPQTRDVPASEKTDAKSV